MKNIIVIGAGPAGMMAGIKAAQSGATVTILEKKPEPGKKLKITGKGRCNITSSLEKEHFLSGYAGGGKFLYSALNEFSNQEVIRFFEQRGVPCKIERGNRVFPRSDNAADVANALINELKRQQAALSVNRRVDELLIKGGRILGVKCGG